MPFDSYCETLHTNFSEYCIIFRQDSDILYIYTSMKTFQGTKGVIRINKSKKDRQHNDQRQKIKMTNNDLQNNIQKTKDRATRTPRYINLTKFYLFSEMNNDISTAVKHFINIAILMISGFKPVIVIFAFLHWFLKFSILQLFLYYKKTRTYRVVVSATLNLHSHIDIF